MVEQDDRARADAVAELLAPVKVDEHPGEVHGVAQLWARGLGMDGRGTQQGCGQQGPGEGAFQDTHWLSSLSGMVSCFFFSIPLSGGMHLSAPPHADALPAQSPQPAGPVAVAELDALYTCVGEKKRHVRRAYVFARLTTGQPRSGHRW